MGAADVSPHDHRVLVLAPADEDADTLRSVLSEAGVGAEFHSDSDGLCLALDDGAGALVLARVARLSDGAHRVVDVASIAGPRAELTLLEALLGGDMGALDEPLERDVLRLADGVVTFRHELARRAVAEHVPPFRRIALHRAVRS